MSTLFGLGISVIVATGCPYDGRPRRRLVVTGDSARIQGETTDISDWFSNVIGIWHCHTLPLFNVSSERLLVILVDLPGIPVHNL